MSHNYIKKRKLQYSYVVHQNGRKKTVKRSYKPASEQDQQKPSVSTINCSEQDSTLSSSEQQEAVSSQSSVYTENTNKKYTKAKSQRLENWADIYKKLVNIGLEQNAITQLTCNECGTDTMDLFRCIDCISWPITCITCLQNRHKHPHLHIFEKWMHGTFFGCSPPTQPWKNILHGSCSSKYTKELVVVDDKGRQHLRSIEFCACEEEAVTLLRYNLWLSSPKHPRLAFHIDLLRWLNGLLLECKVSVKGFCEALKARQPKLYKELVTQEGRQIYKTLINETIHQFRQYIYQMDYCTDSFPDLDDGCSCPACFETDTSIYCFDADFQLVRKSSSGQQWIAPKHKDRFFIEQKLVDNFMSTYASSKVDKECSDFQAGNEIRSKSKNQKLSETAVFGATCRHDFPQKFFSLKHGERLGYAVFLIRLLLSEKKEEHIHVSYDIACLLKRHLEKVGNKEILTKVTFSIPIFHAYGHSASCQILYGPRRTKKLGLTDGEGIERLWSYLGGFSTISKEMTPENRTDLLTDALIYFGQKIREKQGETLVLKLKRAIKLEENTKIALKEILTAVSELEIQDDTFIRWVEEEKSTVLSSNTSDNPMQLNKADEYVLNLQKYYKISVGQSDGKIDEEKGRLEKHLISYEKKNKSLRPRSTDEHYFSNLKTAKDKERKLHLYAVRQHISERQYLLNLVRKYAKGQSVFNRLERQLKYVTKKIHKSIAVYNKVGDPIGELPGMLIFENVKDVDGEIYKSLTRKTASVDISPTIKQEVIQLKCLLDRCCEEKLLLKQEMKSVLNWNKHHYHKIKLKLNAFATAGETSLLLREGMYFELVICKLNALFKEHIGEDTTEITITENVLTDDFEKMQQMLKYVASVEEISVEDIESDTDVEDSDVEEDSLVF